MQAIDQVFAMPQAKQLLLESVKDGLKMTGLSQLAFRMGEGVRVERLAAAPGLGDDND